MSLILKAGWCLLILFAVAANFPIAGSHVQAQTVPVTSARFLGQVTQLTGSTSDPTGFTLDTKNKPVVFLVASNAVYHALSAEADIRGFVIGDYAMVTAKKTRRGWIASRIDFDVQPVVPDQVTLLGTISRVGLPGHRIAIKLDTGETRIVTVTPRTRYRVGGQVVAMLPTLAKGDLVQIVAKKTNGGLIAIEISLRTSSTYAF